MEESNDFKIREIFSILSQGIEIIQYDLDIKANRSTAVGKILWMDTDIYRICCDKVRPTISEKSKNSIPPGLYVRDISEVRCGIKALPFLRISPVPSNPDCCLSLIGSERTIAVEFPSQFSRDWFNERFSLLVNDIIHIESTTTRKYRNIPNMMINPMEQLTDSVVNIRNVLERGVELLQHHHNGKIYHAILQYDATDQLLILKIIDQPYLSIFHIKDQIIDLEDIAEIRPGSHSLGFVRTNCTDRDDRTFSIVSSGNVFDIELINQTTRDLFISQLFAFMKSLQSSAPSSSTVSHNIHLHTNFA